jgi:formylglycine-generating enzyme required for sulfatase activity
VAETRSATRATALVNALDGAEPAAVPRIIEDLTEFRPWAEPLLRQKLAETPPDSRPHLFASLALLPEDPEQVDYLADRLLSAAPEEVAILCAALTEQAPQLTPRYWHVLLQGPDAGQRLRAACALARFAADDARWAQAAPGVLTHLVTENTLLVGRWAELLRPVRRALTPPLLALCGDRSRLESERTLATQLLADYAADQPDVLAALFLDADARQYAVLWPKLRAHRERALALMSQELDRTLTPDWKDAPLATDWATPAPALVRQLENAQGLLAERFALCQTLPLADFAALSEGLRRCGYRPIRCRPYRVAKALQVAVVWLRDGRDWQLTQDVSAANLHRLDQQQRKKGYRLTEVAGYAPATKEVALQYVAVWARPPTPEEKEVRQYLGVAEAEHLKAQKLLQKNFVPVTLHAAVGQDNQLYYSSLWRHQVARWAVQWAADTVAYAGRFPSETIPLDVCLTQTEKRSYAAVWHESAEVTAEESHGLAPAVHLKQCRELAAAGCRPAALSVAWTGEGPALVTASVWHRPVVPEAAQDALAKRQAQAAVTLLRLGQAERVWPLLQHRPEPRLRSFLIHRLSPLGADPRALLQRWPREPEVSARRALLLALGTFDEQQLPPTARQPLLAELLQTYRDHADAGLHGAADWLLRQRWHQAKALEQIDGELRGQPAGKRHWYVNGQGQTMVLLPGPVEFLMGSPGCEPYRQVSAKLHRRRIDRSFALASKEVTVVQFQRFLKDHPEVGHFYSKKFSPEEDGPIIFVSWYEAAMYCRWLSEQEQVLPSQMCYPEVAEILRCAKDKKPLQLPADYLGRTGYRLPTEAEWEYACRAGATTGRFYGESDELLAEYAWYGPNAGQRCWPVGRLKPNDFGLFDVYGNVQEWTHHRNVVYSVGPGGRAAEDKEDSKNVTDLDFRVIRGGGFAQTVPYLRSALRSAGHPSDHADTIGFRVARTHRF